MGKLRPREVDTCPYNKSLLVTRPQPKARPLSSYLQTHSLPAHKHSVPTRPQSPCVPYLGCAHLCVLFFLFLFGSTGVCWLGRHSTTWATPPVLFALVILEIGSRFLPRLAWTTVLLFYTSCHGWDDGGVPPCSALFPSRCGCGLMNFLFPLDCLELWSFWPQPSE
jgi:hypothetical protein